MGGGGFLKLTLYLSWCFTSRAYRTSPSEGPILMILEKIDCQNPTQYQLTNPTQHQLNLYFDQTTQPNQLTWF